MKKVLITGSGVAGLTAAVYAARSNLKPVVITGSNPGGLLTKTSLVENFPGFPDGITGNELVDRMRVQAERWGAVFISASAAKIQLVPHGPQVLELNDGSRMEGRALIIATGSEPRWLGIESEQRFIGRGISSCAVCDGAFFRNLPVAVIGGGDSAAENALTLAKFASKIYLIHWRDKLSAAPVMAERVLNEKKIAVLWNSEVREFLGGNLLTGIRVVNNVSGLETVLPVDGAFVALGHIPGTALVQGQLALKPSGCIQLVDGTSKTGVPGVFAAGDCADCSYRQAVTAAGMGCCAAMDANSFLQQAVGSE